MKPRSCSSKCGCPPPVKNQRTAGFFFLLFLVAGVLLLTFKAVKHLEQDALNAQNLSMVFILGFLTGLHCIGMCGGFMMSYIHFGKAHGMSEWQMHGRYAVAKVFSYTTMGFIFGWLGSFIHFSNNLRALISLLGGIFLLYLGAKSLGLLQRFNHWLSFSIIQWSHLGSDRLSNPTSVGLLKGLMISCAPLQGLYLVAAGVGSPLQGAVLLGIFAVGTLPIFLCYGIFLGTLQQLRMKWADILTAGILVFFGVLMVNRGVALGTFSYPPATPHNTEKITDPPYLMCHSPIYPIAGVDTSCYVKSLRYVENENQQIITMSVTRKGWSKSNIPFQKGKTIRWEIDVKEISICNKVIEIPQLGMKKSLDLGINIIEFSPDNYDKISFTCWMGMMRGTFIAEQRTKS